MGRTSRQIGSAATWSVAARAGRFLLGMVSSVIVVRSLGSSDYGVLSLIRTVLMVVVPLSGLGMGQALLKFIPALRVGEAVDDARRLVARVLITNALAWLALSAAAWLWRGPIERLFGFDGVGVLLAVAVSLSVFEAIFARLSQLMYAAYDGRMVALASLSSHLVYLAGLGVTIPRGMGILGVIVSAAAGYVVAAALVAGRVPAALSFDGAGAEENAGERGVSGGRLFRYAWPMAIIGLLNVVVWRQSETLLLAHFRGAEETGYFDLAYRLPQMLLEFVPASVWPLVMAGVAETYARSVENLPLAIDRYYRVLFLLCAPISAVGVVLGGRAVEVLYGTAMLPAAAPAQLFFAIFTVSFLSTPLSMALMVMERTRVNLLIYIALAAVNVGLDLILIPRYGVWGAVIPVAVTIALQPLLYRLAVARIAPAVRIPSGFVARCFLGSSPVLLMLPLVSRVQGIATLAGAALLAAVVLALSFRVVRVVGPAERELLASLPLPMGARLLKFISP